MPIGEFEAEILRLLARNRNPESYIGGATVLNQSPDSPRQSEDIDVFHDSEAALVRSLSLDLPLLEAQGYDVQEVFSRPSFSRVIVRKASLQSKLEWVVDSAFRFFPVEPDPNLGYRLNRGDLRRMRGRRMSEATSMELIRDAAISFGSPARTAFQLMNARTAKTRLSKPVVTRAA